MDGTKIGRMIRDANELIPGGQCITSGGTLGMVFIAVAINRLADAIEGGAGQIARAMKSEVEANPGGNDGDLSKPGPGTGGVPT